MIGYLLGAIVIGALIYVFVMRDKSDGDVYGPVQRHDGTVIIAPDWPRYTRDLLDFHAAHPNPKTVQNGLVFKAELDTRDQEDKDDHVRKYYLGKGATFVQWGVDVEEK